MIIFDLKREIFVQSRMMGTGDAEMRTNRFPAKVVLKGRAMPGKDVAILKVDSVRHMPTIAVNTDSIARIGEDVLVYGYPEPVTSNTFLAKETSTEPSLTTGIISAIKKSIGGWPVLQMDAVITHGSSGSPVCNNKGEVIGLATFGSLEQATGSLAAGLNFSIPVSIVRDFLDSVQVVPQMSQSSLTFNKGLEFFYQGYYGKAIQKFEAVRKWNSHYPQLDAFVYECEQKIAAGEDKDSFIRKLIYRVMMLVLIVGGIFLFYRWKSEKK